MGSITDRPTETRGARPHTSGTHWPIKWDHGGGDRSCFWQLTVERPTRGFSNNSPAVPGAEFRGRRLRPVRTRWERGNQLPQFYCRIPTKLSPQLGCRAPPRSNVERVAILVLERHCPCACENRQLGLAKLRGLLSAGAFVADEGTYSRLRKRPDLALEQLECHRAQASPA